MVVLCGRGNPLRVPVRLERKAIGWRLRPTTAPEVAARNCGLRSCDANRRAGVRNNWSAHLAPCRLKCLSVIISPAGQQLRACQTVGQTGRPTANASPMPLGRPELPVYSNHIMRHSLARFPQITHWLAQLTSSFKELNCDNDDEPAPSRASTVSRGERSNSKSGGPDAIKIHHHSRRLQNPARGFGEPRANATGCRMRVASQTHTHNATNSPARATHLPRPTRGSCRGDILPVNGLMISLVGGGLSHLGSLTPK